MWLVICRQPDMPIVCFSLRPSLFISCQGRYSGEHTQPRLPSGPCPPLRNSVPVYVAFSFIGKLYMFSQYVKEPFFNVRPCQDSNPLHPSWYRPCNANQSLLGQIKPGTEFFGRFLWENAEFTITLPLID